MHIAYCLCASNVLTQCIRCDPPPTAVLRCFTIHNSNQVLVKDNVGFESVGHCFFLEDATEEQNTLDHNLAVNARSTDTGVIPSDTDAACFWITNANNTVGACVFVCLFYCFTAHAFSA